MPRPRTVNEADLLDAARTVFARSGHAASTVEVAREAGVSQALLYQRYGTKNALFLAAMVPAPVNAHAIVGDIGEIDQLGARGHVVAIAGRLLDHLSEVMPRVLHLVTHPTLAPELGRHLHEHLGAPAVLPAIARRLSVMARDGHACATLDPYAASAALIAIAHGLALHDVAGVDDPTRSEERRGTGDMRARMSTVLDDAVSALWDGLGPEEHARTD